MRAIGSANVAPIAMAAIDRSHIGFEKVGAHSRRVAHVVTDVVGDHTGVSRVVFGNSRLDLADEVGAHVGAFRVNPAADTSEKCDA